MTAKLLILDNRAELYRDNLAPKFPEVEFLLAPDAAAAEKFLDQAEILFTIGPALSKEMVDRAGNLKWIQAMISGMDHMIPLITDRPDIMLSACRGVQGPEMSEVAAYHMLGMLRQTRRLIRNQDKHVWDRFKPNVLDGKTVGILGVGALAQPVARLCQAFGMTTWGLSRTVRDVEGFDRMIHRDKLPEVAGQVDFLIVLVPLSDGTKKLIDAKILKAMRPSAYLINIARGPVVDEAALIEALKAGEIAGAGLDVFETAPLPADSPLWDMENVTITPFIGGFSEEVEARRLTVLEPNLRHYLAGERDKMVFVVN